MGAYAPFESHKMLLLPELLLRRLVPAAASRPCGLMAMARAPPCTEDLLRQVQIVAWERHRLAHEPDAQHFNDREAFFRAYRTPSRAYRPWSLLLLPLASQESHP